jgi:hypothetical protein
VLRRLIARYLGRDDVPLARWLLERPGDEVALRIVPRRLVSWDYGARMAGSPVRAPAGYDPAPERGGA